MRMRLRTLAVLLLCTLIGAGVQAQQKKTVSGVVTESGGTLVQGVTVTEKGTKNVVTTNAQGRYSIEVAPDATLVLTSVGFSPLEISVAGKSDFNVNLSAQAGDLNEVIVTALGVKRDKKSVGYAIQQVKADDITKAAPVDLAQGLAGKVAGLNISTGNGVSNASSRVVIRGNNRIDGNNQPLIVLDGAIMDNNPLPMSNIQDPNYMQDWGNYLSYVNMDNIENVSVLKGPNAAALYGARGANGVILITSKKGTAKKGIGVDYNYTQSFTDVYRFTDVQNEYGGGFAAAFYTAQPKLPKTSSGEQYLPTLYPSAWNGNPYAQGGNGVESSHNTLPFGANTWDIFSWFGASASWGPKLDGSNVRWWDDQVRTYSAQPDNRKSYYQQGVESMHNISFSAANDFGSIRFAAGTTKTTAVVDNTDARLNNFSLGSRVNISKVFSAEISATYNMVQRLNTPEIGNNNSWSKFSVYGMSREYRPLEKGVYKNADGSKYNFPGSYPHAEYANNMYWSLYENNKRLWRDEFVSTVKLNAEITPWLNAFVRTSGNLISTRFEGTNTTTSIDHLSGGSFSKQILKDNVYNTDFMATAHKNDVFTKGFNASLSGMYNIYSNNSFGVQAANNSQFIVPNIYSISNYTDRNNTSFSESRYQVKSQAVLGILNLSYKDYLFLDVTGRNDWNSTLPQENNSFFYPSASAAFVFTEAFDLGKAKDVLSYGKLRLAYGKSANAGDPYKLDVNYDVASFGGQPTNSLPGTIPAQDLHFQTSKSIEVGTSLGFLNDRLNVDFTYYNINSYDQVLTTSMANSAGASYITFNTGNLRNRGVEFIVNYAVIRNKSFSWNIAFNGAKNDNIVESLAPGVTEFRIADVFGNLGAFMKVSPGEKYGTIYGTDFLRDEKGQKQLYNVKDANGDVVGTMYKITNEPVAIGNAAPKLTGGLSNTIRYKNFSLYGMIDFKLGGDIYSVDHATSMGSGLSPATLVERNGGGLPLTYPDGTTSNSGVILDGWNVDDNKVNTRVVSYMYKYAGQYAGWSHINMPRSLSVFENSWVKMREITLSYDLPASMAKRTRIFQGLTLSAIGRNLFYFYSSLPDKLNPEAVNGVGNGQGLQWSAFPSIRSLGFSIRARF
ncbi:MAG TPA: SusC/RagA family TonB-linked outer membrane protein [Flavitalea sp.]|nr:SusC/RagA family TonB-linked outer membrane protein [Flavitalea sp.]